LISTGPMILANLLSVLRMLLAPLVLWSLHREGAGQTTMVLLMAGGVTDLLDGYAARRLRQVSPAGKILDPLADKIFLGSVCSGLTAWHGFPLWLLAMQIVRDVAILAIGAQLLRTRQQVIRANLLGKASTTMMGFTIVCYLLQTPQNLRLAMVVACAIILMLSAGRYAQRWVEILRNHPPAHPA
jgi:CDP-diacylglycerol--glycerol-3-phosphate 3-phosphatidyltransferase